MNLPGLTTAGRLPRRSTEVSLDGKQCVAVQGFLGHRLTKDFTIQKPRPRGIPRLSLTDRTQHDDPAGRL